MPLPSDIGSESSTRPSGKVEYRDVSAIHSILQFNSEVVESLNRKTGIVMLAPPGRRQNCGRFVLKTLSRLGKVFP
jgi:hypothetical protein